MYQARAQVMPQVMPVSTSYRWFSIAIMVALMGLAITPAAESQAQSDPVSGASSLASIVPETALFYAYANLDLESAQADLAADLLERAIGSESLGDQMLDDTASDVPAGAEIAVVVTSIREASDTNAADVSLDPLAATEDLAQGGYALVISTDAPQEAYAALLADLESNVESSGGDVVNSDYNGVAITSYVPETDDDFTEPTAVALFDDYVIQAVYPEDIEPVIDTALGTTPALADSENFQTLTTMLPAEHLALGFINGPAALEALETSAPEVTLNLAEQTTRVLDAWTAFSFSAEQDGFRLETRSLPSSESFEPITPLDASFLDQVPSDAALVIHGNDIDSSGILTSLAFILASGVIGEGLMATPTPGTPTALDQDQVFADAEALLGFNLKTDFVDQLVGEFGSAISVGGSIADANTPPAVDAILVSEVEDTVAVQDVVSKISFIIGAAMGDAGTIETRDVNGSQVSVVELTDSGVADTVEFGVVNGEFVVSVGTALDEYLGGVESPLSEDAGYIADMEHLPTGYGSVTYVNLPIVLSMVTGLTSSFDAGITDADPSCGDYATQEEAQAAYDEDQFENFLLDQDFDGEACEDYFDAPAATPEMAGNPYPNIVGLASVSTQEDGVNGTTTFLLIGDE